MEITYGIAGRSWFLIKEGNIKIHIDPGYVPKDVLMLKTDEKADLILVSHSHWDHLKKELVKDLTGPETKIVGSPKAAKVMGSKAGAMVPGQQIEYDGIKVRAVHAYNPKGLIKYHKRGQCIGFVIEVGGRRLYHAGDTGLIPEMKELGPIDVAILPIGVKFTMDVDEAAEVVHWIRPKVTIPMHNLKTDPSLLANKVGPEFKVVVLNAG